MVPNSLHLDSVSKSHVAWGLRLFSSPQRLCRHHTDNRLSVNCGLVIDLSLPYYDTLGKYATCFSLMALMVFPVNRRAEPEACTALQGCAWSTEEVTTKQREHQAGWLNHCTWMCYVQMCYIQVLHLPDGGYCSLGKAALTAREPGTGSPL